MGGITISPMNIFARSFSAAAILIAATLLVAPAQAQTGGQNLVPIATEPAEVRLDRLFDELKRARNPQAAERVAGRIRQEWSRSGSATVDLMMGWAQEAMQASKNDVALDFLDQVTVLAPDYAEGWNRRATLHYAMNDPAKSMADIDRVLRIEPRHFGALSGLAQILKDAERNQMAMEAYQRVLDVYPMLRSAQDELSELADDLAGEPI
jgi:tetratricopeptide (TPR) repeat protein